MKQLIALYLTLVLAIGLCIQPGIIQVLAEENYGTQTNIALTTDSIVSISPIFGERMSTVDENIYYSMASVNADTLVRIYGNYNTPMFNMLKETINPCMAFATTWGEAGESCKTISLTTVMDFNPNTYVEEIDWVSLSRNLEQVDSLWYYTNAKEDVNTNLDGYAYAIPNALLQFPKEGSRATSTMTGLGVGPYQITSSDWDTWDIDKRVNPIWGWESSLKKCGTGWITCGLTPISDLTVYAALSLGHQGGGLINYPFGRELINIINTQSVQDAFNKAGYQMCQLALEKAYTKDISLSDLNVTSYLTQIESEIGVDFSNYTGGVGRTNKGDYVAKHLLRYCFYKYYFTSGLN